MSLACVVMDCEDKTSVTNHLYRFPTDPSYMKMWCANLKIDDRSLNTKSRVCSRHFHSACLGKMKLKIGSNPTLNLGHDDKDIFLSKLDCTKRVTVRKCNIFGCDNDSRDHILYAFPKCPITRQAWIKACNIKAQNFKYLFICGDHFKPEDLCATKIKKNAFPLYKISGVLKDPLDFDHGDEGNSLPQLNRELPENVKKSAVVACGNDTRGSDKGHPEDINLPVVKFNSELTVTVKKRAVTDCGNDSTSSGRDHGDEFINLPQLNLELPENVEEFAVVVSDNDSRDSNRGHDDDALELNGDLPETVGKCAIAGSGNASTGHNEAEDINLSRLNCKLHENVKKCAVAKCANDARHCTLYPFPTCPIKRQAWIVACNLQGETHKYMYICGKHFKPEDLSGTKLKEDAFPVYGTSVVLDTLNLNNFESEVEPQNENYCENCHTFQKLANHHAKYYMALRTEMREKEDLHKKTQDNLLAKIKSLQLELKQLQHSVLEQKYYDGFKNVLF